ncbi:ErmE/ErmH/ErmO/ErmR family 23S rRNA (adenine(2058)-N(6))-methyltransferase [Nocardiopsis sp. TSRI0078]|uniref:ErmE/ErmH/ErmO/ErmR family 23S rRNA (adenine(2058)-N(6))-methyltransferase n=1 Tax=unclassified Nocardiopsis TaxID=2649073 RepID=UPI0009391786|nr:ErmE/ErmH/ErmO/ErmR family 23S rRNA (adenine(2058)-N(6))-methyltransferase [Nocardiopsis sp. TSRI0078]OKI12341.1 ErmE/ErmH/ErmO/ErmR family 23S rRNA (adenine(2058)-N(6))-methyltransferase [Nocardiopsis sp. TSRI0078]
MARTARSPHTGTGGDRRRLSQNFLTDPSWARRVVRTAGVGPDDLVVEVGPGDGALTRFLAPAVRRVVAYEIDPRLAERLSERYRDPASGVRVVRADFIRARPPRGEFHVVGNIPYARTADIVRWCLDAHGLASATLVTQLEYARKRTGGFGRWSRLTVLTWPEWSWSLAGRIDRRRFWPVPRVDAGLLVLRRRRTPLVPPERMGGYRRMVESGFGGAGGSLGASLRRTRPARRVDRALARAGIAPGTPVGHVSPQQWLEVFDVLEGEGAAGSRR